MPFKKLTGEIRRRRLLFGEKVRAEVDSLIAVERLQRTGSLDLSHLSLEDVPVEIADLSWLTHLDCDSTNVSDLSMLARLPALTQLACEHTTVSDLSPLSGLVAMTHLYCSGTSVSDLSTLAGLNALAKLDCSYTQVSDLMPLVGLTNLTELDCCFTLVSDLSPIKKLVGLENLYCTQYPADSIPDEILSQEHYDNCLPRLRSYWANEAGGSEPLRQHKLFLLGNGTVGKTQVARRLMGLEYDAAIPSTHGIQLHAHPLPARPDAGDARAGEAFDARIWDFGGQDYRNRPLAYWLDYVRNLAGPGAQVILVQTQCDKPGAPLTPPIDLSPWRDLEGLDICRTSALRGSGFADLTEKIADAVARLEEPALHMIGTCERRVIDAIADLRARGTRTLRQGEFDAICEQADVQGQPEHLLHFLHHAGELFQLGEQILVDQRWALDAIYTVFNREECWQAIRARRGRFKLADLAQGVWRDHSGEECAQFLAMMLKCGMAFEYIEEDKGWHEAIHIAPDLLPERGDPSAAKWIERYWDDGGAVERRTVAFPLLHDGLMREIMSGIGKDAGLHAVYWKNGLLFSDGRTKAVAMIEAHWPDPGGWAGEIVITAQRSRAAELAGVMERHVRAVARRIGLAADRVEAGPPDASDAFARAASQDREGEEGHEMLARDPGFIAVQGQPLRPTCYVSYAWGDGTEAADANEALVDAFCAAAEERGIDICRDKTHQRDGDWIDEFIEQIKLADRVFAVIGARYWTRPYCMAELHGIWRRCKSDPEIFKERVREFLCPDSGLMELGFLSRLRNTWHEKRTLLQAADSNDLEADQQLARDQAEKWIADAQDIVNAMRGKLRSYEGDFAAYTEKMLDELDGKGDYAPEG